MNYFCIPADFKLETLKKLHELNCKNDNFQVKELYGQISSDITFPSGRNNIPSVSVSEVKTYIKEVHSYHMEFDYTLNGAHMNNIEFTPGGIKKIVDFFHLLEDIGVDSLTVSLVPLIELVKEYQFNFKIVVSTINQISNVNLATFYDNLGIDRLVIGESINRDLKMIQAIKENVKCDLEAIANSLCSIYCPFRMQHYNQIAQCSTQPNNVADSYYSNRCLARRLDNPVEFMKVAFIRPEDLNYYTQTGCNHFKIQGRGLIQQGDIIRTLEAYMNQSYTGNLLELLNLFGRKTNELYIDNKSLDGFLENYLTMNHCRYGCQGCTCCQSYFEKSCFSNLQRTALIKDSILQHDAFNQITRIKEG